MTNELTLISESLFPVFRILLHALSYRLDRRDRQNVFVFLPVLHNAIIEPSLFLSANSGIGLSEMETM